jgi:basic amino acid/polyamine antiporter, APA family
MTESINTPNAAAAGSSDSATRGFVRGLGLFDSVMVVAGAMIGSGIFIVSADMSRLVGSPGALLLAWAVTAVLTIAAALSYGELSSMIPHAGGMYVYLREAYSPLWGFLYGWTLFGVIQTGTIAAVAVAFARFSNVLWPTISEQNYLIAPIHLSAHYAISLSTAQLTGIVVIVLLTWTNTRGLEYGKIVQNIFTVAKAGALAALILLGFTIGRNAHAIAENFGRLWTARGFHPISGSLDCTTAVGLVVAICVAQSGSLFAADSWHDVTFAAEEVKRPEWTLPRALALGVAAVVILYFLANVAYLTILPFSAIQRAPEDLVATAALHAIFPGFGTVLMALAIMVSCFGCINALVLAGPRAYYAMATDGLFFKSASRLNRQRVPGWSLAAQGVWAAFLVLPRTYNPATRQYGSLYSNLLDYVISAALIFYVLTIAGVIRLRSKRPNLPRPFLTPGYPLVPLVYIAGASLILAALLVFRPSTTWPGLVIVLAGLVVYLVLRKSRSRPAP